MFSYSFKSIGFRSEVEHEHSQNGFLLTIITTKRFCDIGHECTDLFVVQDLFIIYINKQTCDNALSNQGLFIKIHTVMG